ncbi:MAG: hypothetical protein MHMPM18_000226 [Marteilia pararefringens]
MRSICPDLNQIEHVQDQISELSDKRVMRNESELKIEISDSLQDEFPQATCIRTPELQIAPAMDCNNSLYNVNHSS